MWIARGRPDPPDTAERGGAGLVERIDKARQMAPAADQVEEIAVLAGRSIGLMLNCT